FGGYEGLRSVLGNAFSMKVPETAAQAIADPQNSMVDAILALQGKGVAVSSVSKAIMGCPLVALTATDTCAGNIVQGLSGGSNAHTTGYLSTLPNTNTSNNAIAKLDYRINSKNMINGMLWVGRYDGVGEDHAMVNPAFLDTAQ